MGLNDSAERMLEAAYSDLGFAGDNLLAAMDSPDDDMPSEAWIERGEWLATAKEAHAESLFFVDGNPVVVFAKHDNDDPSALRRMINRIWCMARPRLLFLALPGELMVFDLADKPISVGEESSFLHSKRVLETAKGVQNVQEKLLNYNREQIECGRLFEDKRFEKPNNRADEMLIKNLRTLRAKLMDIPASGNLPFELKHAHALIGRSIFIRYLEDRQILLRKHFQEVATGNPHWQRILEMPYEKEGLEPGMEGKLYPKVLADKEFTYALFNWLAVEFNGDMFPRDPHEQESVASEHLLLLRRFLLGDVDDQPNLFFYAYDFQVIPIELISSIYEETYTTETGKKTDEGTHYTPSALVELILSRVLTPVRLAENPRILDPACGSGIFLVEAFRRIVRYRTGLKGASLSSDELREILRNQIAGIEIHPEAVRVAAFSLYLALLHYQDPSSISAHRKLPYLLYDGQKHSDDSERYNILLKANSFDLESFLTDPQIAIRFGASCTDVVVGNPPWGFPKRKKRKKGEPPATAEEKAVEDRAITEANKAFEWCKRQDRYTGDKELSQAFVHRSISFLKEGGTAGFLLSSGVLFKSHEKTRAFRRQWLEAVTLQHIVNFVHVRDIFFSNAIAPFVSAVFRKGTACTAAPFEYWSAKKTILTTQLRAPVLSRVDLRLLSQQEVTRWDAMWKIHWWGSHQDEALIRKLQLEQQLGTVEVEGRKLIQYSGRGYQDCPDQERQTSSEKLREYKELRPEDLKSYGPLTLTPPRIRDKVHSLGKLCELDKSPVLYDGTRLLFARGVRSLSTTRSGIAARLACTPFCFRNSVLAFRFGDGMERQAKVILGICWSSLASYYLFLTAGSWGPWHDDLQLEEQVRKLPIRLPKDTGPSDRIVSIVDELLNTDTFMTGRIAELERALDESVFDLYELREAERDLILDMNAIGLDFFYKNTGSDAVKHLRRSISETYGVLADLPSQREKSVTMSGYLYAFLRIWNRELEPDGEFTWQVVCPGMNSPMIGVIFSTQYKHDPLPNPGSLDTAEWKELLKRLDKQSIHHYGSRGLYTDCLVRSVSPTQIMIIKRNEQRLWTRSMAREDAEAAMLQAIYHQEIAEDAAHGSA